MPRQISNGKHFKGSSPRLPEAYVRHNDITWSRQVDRRLAFPRTYYRQQSTVRHHIQALKNNRSDPKDRWSTHCLVETTIVFRGIQYRQQQPSCKTSCNEGQFPVCVRLRSTFLSLTLCPGIVDISRRFGLSQKLIRACTLIRVQA